MKIDAIRRYMMKSVGYVCGNGFVNVSAVCKSHLHESRFDTRAPTLNAAGLGHGRRIRTLARPPEGLRRLD